MEPFLPGMSLLSAVKSLHWLGLLRAKLTGKLKGIKEHSPLCAKPTEGGLEFKIDF